MGKLKTLTKRDHVTCLFGEWFDKTYGNTYYDCLVWINDKSYKVPYQYGYNHGDRQAVEGALKHCGYRLRSGKGGAYWPPFRRVVVAVMPKLKRELYRGGIRSSSPTLHTTF